MKPNRLIAAVLTGVLAATFLGGCSESRRVSHNISKEADNFQVYRRLVVINTRTDEPLFEISGLLSITVDADNDLNVMAQVGPSEFKKHFVHLNLNTTYVVEDISGAQVSPWHYEVSYLPKAIIPFVFTVEL